MASKTSKPELDADRGLRRVSHREKVEKLVRRRAEVGEVEVPRNSGLRRNASKRALLKAIEDAGGKW
ncbi:MAG: hypothetical protein JF595_14175 [Sphingomonadales bacterium]|nr:hypothetical protein [Sphingomonadales bacterium]